MNKELPDTFVARAIAAEDEKAFAEDPERFRRSRRGRGGSGAREVKAWWYQIDAAICRGIPVKRIWSYIHSIDEPPQSLPRLTIGYEAFLKQVQRRIRAEIDGKALPADVEVTMSPEEQNAMLRIMKESGDPFELSEEQYKEMMHRSR